MGMLVDLINDVLSAVLIAPQAVTVTGTVTASITATSTFLDMSDCEVSTGAIVAMGAVSGTSPSYSLQIEESNGVSDGWTFTAIPGLQFVSLSTTNGQVTQRGLRTKQFVRANVTNQTGSATPSVTLSLTVIAQRRFTAASGAQAGYSRSPST